MIATNLTSTLLQVVTWKFSTTRSSPLFSLSQSTRLSCVPSFRICFNEVLAYPCCVCFVDFLMPLMTYDLCGTRIFYTRTHFYYQSNLRMSSEVAALQPRNDKMTELIVKLQREYNMSKSHDPLSRYNVLKVRIDASASWEWDIVILFFPIS